MTTDKLKPIMEALQALGIRKGTRVRLVAKRGRTAVYIDGERVGIYDHERQTFVD